ncbi:MAG: hypothetical protein NUV77_20915 [Thermoguttaceae bacterium]|jgi:hypothetical protein|nr:hypothetical protein [Thermoguttaceae bacterium]
MFSGGEMLRLLSMITMLVVIAMLMSRARDPSVWRWLASDETAESEPNAAETMTAEALSHAADSKAPSAAVTSAPPDQSRSGSDAGLASQSPGNGPAALTDQDYEEWEAFKEEALALDDFTFYFQREEMEAYDRLVRWVLRQPFEGMWQRAGSERGKVTFNDFVQNRKQLRGKLVRLDLHLRRVLKMPEKTRDGAELYEAWGYTTQSGGWLYSVVIVDKPDDLPVGELIQEDVRVAGYFLKMLSYHSALSKPGDKPLYAPVLVGRVMRVKPPAPPPSETAWVAESPTAKVLGLLLFGVFVVAIVGWQLASVLLRTRKRHGSMREIHGDTPRSGQLAVDEWLDRAGEVGRLETARSAEETASPFGIAGGNGHTIGFDGGLDTGPAKSE